LNLNIEILNIMKVLQIITLGNLYYGAQSHVLNLSQGLVERGHDVLVAMGPTGVFNDRLEEVGLPWVHIPSLVHEINLAKDLQTIWEIRSLIKLEKPDLIATHSGKAGVVGRVAAKLAGVPSTYTAHGWTFAQGVPNRRRLIALYTEKLTAKITDRIITVANADKEYALSQGVSNKYQMETVYYGVSDQTGNHEDTSASLIKPDNGEPIVLTMIAGFRPQKDHLTLLLALSSLKNLNWKLQLLGDGELKESIERKVAELDLHNRVQFYGAVKDVFDYLSQTDVLILITHWEGLPISTLEGLAHGLPVVATDVAGVREQVINDENGFLTDHENVDSVKNALEKLILNQDLRDRFSKSSRQLFEDKFTLDVMVDRTVDLYTDVLASHVVKDT